MSSADDQSSLAGDYVPRPTEQPRARRRPHHTVLSVAAFLLFTTGVVAAGTTGDGPTATPEDAVRAFLSDAADADLAAALGRLPAGERTAMAQPLADVERHLARLGMEPPAAKDLDAARLELTSQALAPDVALVRIEGADRETLARRGGWALDGIVGAMVWQSAFVSFDERPKDDSPVEVVALRRDGQWQPSVWYSAADNLRRAGGFDVPPFGAGVAAAGAASPEAAAEAFLRAGTDPLRTNLVAMTDPVDEQVLHDYGALEVAPEEEPPFDLPMPELTELELEAHVEGDEATVRIARAVLDMAGFDGPGFADDKRIVITYDGQCVTVEGPGAEQFLEDNDRCGPWAVAALGAGGTFGGTMIRVVRREGAWFVRSAGVLKELVAYLATIQPGTDEAREVTDSTNESGSLADLLTIPLMSLLPPDLAFPDDVDLEEDSDEPVWLAECDAAAEAAAPGGDAAYEQAWDDCAAEHGEPPERVPPPMDGAAFECIQAAAPEGPDQKPSMEAFEACVAEKVAAGEITQEEADRLRQILLCAEAAVTEAATTEGAGEDAYLEACAP